MAIEQKIIGTKVLFIDRPNKLLFTKTELEKARDRYENELAKAIAKQQG